MRTTIAIIATALLLTGCAAETSDTAARSSYGRAVLSSNPKSLGMTYYPRNSASVAAQQGCPTSPRLQPSMACLRR